jgi:cytochrome c556
MKGSIFSAGALLLVASIASASAEPIAERQQTMKAVGGAFYRDIGRMVKEEVPFDGAKAQASLDTIIDAARKMPTLFPDDSKTGGETAALPAIWENKADFNAKWDGILKLASAEKTNVKDLATLKVAQKALNDNCNACHKDYRARAK